jgi:hypothetical protein
MFITHAPEMGKAEKSYKMLVSIVTQEVVGGNKINMNYLSVILIYNNHDFIL